MGNCASAQPYTPSTKPKPPNIPGSPSRPNPSDPLPYYPLTYIVAHRAPSPPDCPPLWFFEYRLNMGPVCPGQRVSLHLRSEDCFNPDPSLGPVAKGRLGRVISCNPHWMTFPIEDKKGRVIALLSVPYVLLIQHTTDNWHSPPPRDYSAHAPWARRPALAHYQ
jgi:hypothetical protein